MNFVIWERNVKVIKSDINNGIKVKVLILIYFS